jgi:hypothetical protein
MAPAGDDAPVGRQGRQGHRLGQTGDEGRLDAGAGRAYRHAAGWSPARHIRGRARPGSRRVRRRRRSGSQHALALCAAGLDGLSRSRAPAISSARPGSGSRPSSRPAEPAATAAAVRLDLALDRGRRPSMTFCGRPWAENSRRTGLGRPAAQVSRIALGVGLDQPVLLGIAADVSYTRCGRTLVGLAPGLQRRGGRGGGILRIERQQHDLGPVRRPSTSRPSGRSAASSSAWR